MAGAGIPDLPAFRSDAERLAYVRRLEENRKALLAGLAQIMADHPAPDPQTASRERQELRFLADLCHNPAATDEPRVMQ